MSSESGLSEEQLTEWLKFAKSAARAAGDLITEKFAGRTWKEESGVTKLNDTDIQTIVDQKCEELIVSRIQRRYPSHKIVAEESWNEHSHSDEYFSKSNSTPVWFIDPIDGTTNFVHSLPFVCVLIGLRVKGSAVLGVVHAPILGQTYWAAQGMGAFMNGRRLSTSQCTSLSKAMVLSEFGYDRSIEGSKQQCDRLATLLSEAKVRAIRCFGSCGMNMVGIAKGVADLYFEGRDETYGPKPWDFTAPEIIVREAGGVILQPEGAEFDCRNGRILCCANASLARQFLKLGFYSDTLKPDSVRCKL